MSHTVNQIEKSIHKKQHCVGLFLDIQAAFDTISPNYIKECLIKKQIDNDAAEWYYDYITHRNLNTDITGHEGKVSINMGFPQGGVCSAKFWIIASIEHWKSSTVAQLKGMASRMTYVS